MKQSQNALTYLMAQYRAVYGRAYVKGLASAFAVTAVIAAPEVGAQVISGVDDYDKITEDNRETIIVNDGTGTTIDQANNKFGILRVDLDSQSTLDINNNESAHVRDYVAVHTGTTLNVGTSGDGYIYGSEDSFSPNQNMTLQVLGNVNVGSKANNSIGVIEANAGEFGLITSRQGNVTIEGRDGNWDEHSRIVGAVGTTTPDQSRTPGLKVGGDAQININDNGTFAVDTGGVMDIDATVNLNGSESILRGADNFDQNGFNTANTEAAGNIVLNQNGNINVTGGKTGIYTADLDINGGRISVQNGGQVTLDGDMIQTGTTLDQAGHAAADITMTGGVIEIADGGKIVIGRGTYGENDASWNPPSETTLNVQGGEIVGEGTLEVQGTAKLTETVINNFVNGVNADLAPVNGHLALNGGNVDLTIDSATPDNYDLSKYKFTSDASKATDANTDFYVESSDGSDVSTINLSRADGQPTSAQITKGLAEDGTELNLDISADKFTLGGGAGYDSDTQGLGFRKVKGRDVVFNPDEDGSAFTLRDGVSLSAIDHEYNGQPAYVAGSGSSTGDVVISNGTTDPHSSYHVAAGHITHTGDMTLKGGSIYIGQMDGEEGAGLNADLTLENKHLGLDNTNGDNLISLEGSTGMIPGKVPINPDDPGEGWIDGEIEAIGHARLDLSDTTVDLTRDTTNTNITTINTGKNGELTINSDQLGQFTNEAGEAGTGVNMVIDEGTVNVVSGATGHTPAVDVAKLTKGDKAAATESDYIYFNNGGTLNATDLVLTNNQGADKNTFDIGTGVINVNNLNVTSTANAGDPNASNTIVMAGGNLNVSGSFNSNDGSVDSFQVGAGNSLSEGSEANLNLNGTSGQVNMDLAVRGGDANNTASININKGIWQVKNIDVAGTGGSVNIGSATDGTAVTLEGDNLAVQNNGSLDVALGSNVSFDNVNASTGNVHVDGNINVGAGGNALFGQALTGTGNINVGANGNTLVTEGGLDTFLGADPNDTNTRTGHINLAGGTLTVNSTDPNTAVDLNDYTFSSTNGEADINIESESTIIGNNLAITGVLGKDKGATPGTNVSDQLNIDANKLTLGGAEGFDSSQESLYKTAKIHGIDSAVTFNKDAGTGNDYSLRSDLSISAVNPNGDNPVTPDVETNVPTASTGNVNGSVQVINGATFTAEGGSINQNGNITLANGNLTVGNTTAGEAAGVDASLNFAEGSSLTIDNTNGSNKITVAGNGANSVTGTQAHSSLDLSKIAININRDTTNTNLTTFDVGSNADIKVSAGTLDKIVNSTGEAGTGANVIINDGGEFIATGDAQGTVPSIDVSKMTELADGDKANATATDTIYFNGGVLRGEDLKITNTDTTQTKGIDIGTGTIIAGSLDLSNSDTTTSGSGSFLVDTGNLQLTKGVISNDGTVNRIQIGADNSQVGDVANVTLATETADGSGSLGLDINVGGHDTNTGGAALGSANLNVVQGNWNAGNVNVAGNGQINVGDSTGANGQSANFNVQDLNLESGGDLNVYNGSTTVTANTKLGDGAIINLAGDSSKLVVTGSGDFLQGSIQGTGDLEVRGGEADITFGGLRQFVKIGDSGGSVTLSGGKLAIDTSAAKNPRLDMAQFTYTSDGQDVDADINVISTDAGAAASTIANADVIINKNLSTNGEELNLNIETTNLELGGGAGFDSTTNGLNYLTATTKNVKFVQDADDGSDFTLHDGVNLVATTTGSDGVTTVADTGVSEGNVIINGGADAPETAYRVQAGNYSHNGDMTLNNGAIIIGNAQAGDVGEGIDASITVGSGQNFTVDNSTAGSTVTITGNGNGAQASLDLTQGNVSVTASATPSVATAIKVGHFDGTGPSTSDERDSSLNVTQTQAEMFQSGVAVHVGSGGIFNIEEDPTSTTTGAGASVLAAGDGPVYDLSQLVEYTPDTPIESGKVYFGDNGLMVSDDLTVNNSGDATAALDIGNGIIRTNTLALNNDTAGVDGTFTFADGTLDVNESLTSTNKSITVGNGTADSATLNLGSSVHVSPLPTPTGTVNTSLIANGGNINVNAGDWTLSSGGVNQDLTINGGTLTVGTGVEVAPPDDDPNTPDEVPVIDTSLTAGTGTFTNSDITVNNNGDLLLDGMALNGGNTVDILGHGKADNTFITSGNGNQVNVSGANAVFELGSQATNDNITIDDNGTTLTTAIDNVFNLTGKGTLKLNFGADKSFTLDQIKDLRKDVISGSDGTVLTDGYINIGNATVEGLDAILKYDPSNPPDNISTDIEIDYGEGGDLLADLKDFKIDALTNGLLTEVPLENEGDYVEVASVAAIKGKTVAGADEDQIRAEHIVLGNSDRNSGNFITDLDGKLLGAIIGTEDGSGGGYLALQNGGNIGKIDIDAGVASADGTTDNTFEILEHESGDTTFITNIESVNGGANTKFIVGDEAVVANGVTVGDLVANSKLSVQSGDVILSEGLSGDTTGNIIVNQGDLNVTGTTNYQGAFTAKNAVFNGDTTLAGTGNVAGEGSFESKLNLKTGANLQFGDDVAVGGEAIIESGSNLAGVNVTFDDKGTIAGTVTSSNVATFNGETTISGGSVHAVRAKFNNDATLNGGNINASNRVEFFGKADIDATSQVTAENITFSQEANVAGNLNIGNNATFEGNTTLNGTNQFNNANFASTVTLGGNSTFSGDVIIDGKATFNGKTTLSKTTINADADFKSGSTTTFENGEDIFISGTALQESGATIDAGHTDTFTFAGNTTLAGVADFNTVNFNGTETKLTGQITANKAYGQSGDIIEVGNPNATADAAAATFETRTMALNGGTLFVDPAYGSKTSLVAINKFRPVGVDNPVDVGTTDGNILVGRNAAVGLGTNLTNLQNAISQYQDPNNSGSFGSGADDVGNALYLGESIHVKDGNYIVLDADATNLTEAEQFRTDNGSADLALSNRSAIIVNNLALRNDQGQETTAITFEKQGATVFAENGSKVIFSNYDFLDNTVDIFDDADKNGVTVSGSNIGIAVASQSDLLVGNIEVGDDKGLDVQLTLNENVLANMDISESSKKTIRDYFSSANNLPTDENGGLDGTDGTGNGTSSGTGSADGSTGTGGSTGGADNSNGSTSSGNGGDNNNVLDDPLNNRSSSAANDYMSRAIASSPRAIDDASHASVFGGVVTTAIAAGNTTYDAVAARTGIGNAALSNTTNDLSNGTGGGLWITPTYNHRETDGFGINSDGTGGSHGVDLDLYGVAVGAELNLNPNVTLGVVANVGAGTADGTGVASSTSNDFNYYGGGAYVGMKFGAVRILGDASYTVVDNDIETNNSIDKLSTSFDSTNLSLGLTGQIDLDLAGIKVSPHIGLRYSQIDINDYTIKNSSGQTLGEYGADKINIMSVPVGVTIAKELHLNDWVLKPQLDLTVTSNFGDDTEDGRFAWADLGHTNSNISSEILDDFTYGATVGFSAQNGNFHFGLGANYTGSSNSDDYGVKASLRYDF